MNVRTQINHIFIYVTQMVAPPGPRGAAGRGPDSRCRGQGVPGAGRQRQTRLGQPGQWNEGSQGQPSLWSHFGTGLGDPVVPDPPLTGAENGQYWAPEAAA